MGDYTRFEFSTKLRADTPAGVINVLRYMIAMDDDSETPPLPEHILFSAERWASLFVSNSTYHPDTCPENGAQPSTLNADDQSWRLNVLSSLKNYNSEIELFCDWIAPYLDEIDGTELGSVQCDEAEPGTRLIKDQGVIVRLQVEAYDDEASVYAGFGNR